MLFPQSTYYEHMVTLDYRPKISDLKLRSSSVPIDSILYFEETGELRRYGITFREKTTIKTALFREAIFDASGEVIGFKAPVKTKVVTEDKRRTKLVYKKAKTKLKL